MKKREIYSPDCKQGFSLIEVLISMAILTTLIFIASTSFLNTAPKYRLNKAVWEIHSRLNYARYKAILEGISIKIRFLPKSYIIEKFYESQKNWRIERKYSLEGVTVQANNSPIFHPEGTVSNLASILISNSWGKYKITLAITGRIKIVKL